MFSVNFRVIPSEGLVYSRLTECMEGDKQMQRGKQNAYGDRGVAGKV
jgi:hypothetical protein